MRIARRARLHQNVALATQASLHQTRMHRAGGEQRVNGQLASHQIPIGEQQHELAVPHGGFRAIADPQDGALQVEFFLVLQVEKFMRDARVGHAHDLPQLALREHGRVEHDLIRVLRRRHEDIALRSDLRLQRHDDAFAQTIDGRIGDLRELLTEIVVQRARFLRQHGHGRVIAHRAHGLAFILGQNADDFIALLGGDVVHLLEQRQRVAVHRLGGEPRIDQIRLQIAHALLQPGLVRMPALEQFIDPLGVHELCGLQIQREDLTGPELAFLDHVLRLVVPHAGFGGDGDVSVLGDDPARRAQAVAIQRAAGIAAIGEHHTGRTIPGLHVRGVIFVKGFQIRVDHVHGLPGRRDQQPHGMHGIQAAHEQQFEHVVQ